MATRTMTIVRIEDEGDRVLIYRDEDYRVISGPERAAGLKVGDQIEYEPCGFSFGWFIRRLPAATVRAPDAT